ncbi:SAM-dependent methyltransferase [Lichenihabitans sp. Uapishka_5]|uniref:SAM-dependent methyltransferase n=1 Tax=Lichenihabitans sp. Uapishka_5 TaxID=3037302 RepID=UPI0029E807FE|nr:SAM-dependent methyltransferase [Lichenihabitans sp. Uapishka_5]MDX7950912.1 SAM-dependent methyltransferase [Lichenihabitans sp. Uapishka_5]
MSADDPRPGEVTVVRPAATDAGVHFLGRLHTPWLTRQDCPKRGDPQDGPICRVVVDPPWRAALAGLDRYAEVEILYWMHLARRDLVVQRPRSSGLAHGTFALRSPMRPNPISSSVVVLLAVEPDGLMVRGLDCVDGTPLIDIKPLRCPMAPPAAGRQDD